MTSYQVGSRTHVSKNGAEVAGYQCRRWLRRNEVRCSPSVCARVCVSLSVSLSLCLSVSLSLCLSLSLALSLSVSLSLALSRSLPLCLSVSFRMPCVTIILGGQWFVHCTQTTFSLLYCSAGTNLAQSFECSAQTLTLRGSRSCLMHLAECSQTCTSSSRRRAILGARG